MLHFLTESIIRSSWILPFAFVWRFFAWIRNVFYDLGIFKTISVNVPILSIGNISLGGTGKTPLVIFLANHFAKRKLAVVSRGYGDGDELKIIKNRCPFVKIYAGKDRVKLAKIAKDEGAELILLEDGFQHRRLKRDWDLVLLDPTAKLLREGKKRLKTVDLIGSFHEIEAAVEFKVEAKTSLEKGTKVALFCGIANPWRFEKTVRGLGLNVVGRLFLKDHGKVTEKKLKKFYDKTGADCLVCTEKDWVKLPKADIPIYFIPIEVVLKKGIENWLAFLAKIDKRLDNNSHHED